MSVKDKVKTVKVSFEMEVEFEGRERTAMKAFRGGLKSFLNNEFEDGLNSYVGGHAEQLGLDVYVWVSHDVKKLKVS